jgi:hypothetical protein
MMMTPKATFIPIQTQLLFSDNHDNQPASKMDPTSYFTRDLRICVRYLAWVMSARSEQQKKHTSLARMTTTTTTFVPR